MSWLQLHAITLENVIKLQLITIKILITPTLNCSKTFDDFFVSCWDEDNNNCSDIPQPTWAALEEVHENSSCLVREHGYSVLDRCKRIVSGLNMLALNMYYQENLSYLPSQIQPYVKEQHS